MERNNPPKSVAEQVQESVKDCARPKKEVKPQDLYPSGSTMVNLACSDNYRGAFKLGTIVTLPGSSTSGKSMQGETALAEGINDKRFDDYDFFRDDAEAAYNFDTRYLWGDKVADTVKKPPLGLSNTVQMFQANMLIVTKKGPCIYLLDTLDSLSSDEELEKEMRRALAMAKSEEAAKKIAGSFGMEKAKILGQVLRMIKQELEKSRSLLIIVQQLRQNTNAVMFGSPYTTSGGEAPFFYSFHQLWLNKTGTLKLNDLKVGTQVEAKITKNKLNGKLREVTFNIWYDYGIDDIRSMVDFLLKMKVWEKNGQNLDATDIGVSGSYLVNGTGDFMDKVVLAGKLPDLKKLVGQVWVEREESVRLNRIPRF